jgi:hypothetical protein
MSTLYSDHICSFTVTDKVVIQITIHQAELTQHRTKSSVRFNGKLYLSPLWNPTSYYLPKLFLSTEIWNRLRIIIIHIKCWHLTFKYGNSSKSGRKKRYCYKSNSLFMDISLFLNRCSTGSVYSLLVMSVTQYVFLEVKIQFLNII